MTKPSANGKPLSSGKPVAKGKTAVNAKPDFAKMSRAEKLAYNQAERDRVFGA
jgi:hypothetical protein